MILEAQMTFACDDVQQTLLYDIIRVVGVTLRKAGRAVCKKRSLLLPNGDDVERIINRRMDMPGLSIRWPGLLFGKSLVGGSPASLPHSGAGGVKGFSDNAGRWSNGSLMNLI